MNKSVTLVLFVVVSMTVLVSANSIYGNVPHENQINASVGKDFKITLEANPGSTGFTWWTNFDTQYVSLVNSTFVHGNAGSGMVGVPGMEIFTFNAKRAGKTEVNMLLFRPWINGTVVDNKLFQINIR
jgi:predicted secreted protein